MRYVRSVILTNLHAEHIVGSVLDSYLYAGAFIDRRALKSTRMSVHTSEISISISTRTYAGAVSLAILVNSQSAGQDTFVCLSAVKKKVPLCLCLCVVPLHTYGITTQAHSQEEGESSFFLCLRLYLRSPSPHALFLLLLLVALSFRVCWTRWKGVQCMLVKFSARKAAWLKTSCAKKPGWS